MSGNLRFGNRLSVGSVSILFLSGFLSLTGCNGKNDEPRPPVFQGEIKVGILHSRSGTMAFSEGAAAEGEALAIEEINAKGGLVIAGKRLKIVPIEEDGESDPKVFAEKARKLIEVDQVSVVFGGWTSASRKSMLPVFEDNNHLLFYPIQYEGEECSPNIFYGGMTPNQQIEPAIEWLIRNKGQRFYLIGSDYVFPRTANVVVRNEVTTQGGAILGERYIPLGSMEMDKTMEAIRSALPEGGILINTLNGDSNLAFFKALKRNYLTPANGYLTMSFSIAEQEAAEIGAEYLEGTYATWSFFQNLDTPESRRFTKAYKYRFGSKRVTSDPSESGYTLVHLWATGVEKAGSFDAVKVRKNLVGISFDSPEGKVTFRENHHLSKLSLIGELQADGLFSIVANNGVIEPKTWNESFRSGNAEDCDPK